MIHTYEQRYLIVALCICYTRLCIPPVGKGVHNVAHVPVMVAQGFQDVDPLV